MRRSGLGPSAPPQARTCSTTHGRRWTRLLAEPRAERRGSTTGKAGATARPRRRERAPAGNTGWKQQARGDEAREASAPAALRRAVSRRRRQPALPPPRQAACARARGSPSPHLNLIEHPAALQRLHQQVPQLRVLLRRCGRHLVSPWQPPKLR